MAIVSNPEDSFSVSTKKPEGPVLCYLCKDMILGYEIWTAGNPPRCRDKKACEQRRQDNQKPKGLKN